MLGHEASSQSEHQSAIKLLLVDDQQLFAKSLSVFLTNYAEEISVIGIAPDGKAAIDFAERFLPDIILMDVYMPGMTGIEATTKIKRKHPSIKILMLSTYEEEEFVHQALSCGASGYVLKDISPTELIASIRALHSGVVQISPQIAQKLVQHFHENVRLSEKGFAERFPMYETLTQREKEIFFQMATGHDNSEIAERLNISEQTTRNYTSSIYSKLNLRTRFEIIQLANRIQAKD